MSNPVTIQSEDEQPQDIEITPSELELIKQRRRERITDRADEARVFNQFGSKVMKVKLKALAAIGADVESMGVKKIGHGKIAVAGDNAHVLVDYLVDLVQQLHKKGADKDPEVIISAVKEIRALNQQIMDSGIEHIEADKQVNGGNTGPHLTIPFPAGTPLMVGVPAGKPVPVESTPP